MLDDIPRAAFADFPLSLPALRGGLDVELTSPITIVVGANGSGKSTILEAIASHCGFALTGGNKNIAHRSSEHEHLADFLRLSWLPKMTEGFFFRAETFFQFIDTIDQLAEESGARIYDSYGGVSMRERSHGQSFMAVFENRFGRRGLYLMDEPEAALSPQRQVDFLHLLRRLEREGQSQIIMATHSPMLMAYPSATLLEVSDAGLKPIEFHETTHFKIWRQFALNPDGFMAGVMMDADEAADASDDD
ncbi:MAG: AAA family ATPase [Caulobacterales bacterium]|nr:AAA family ATPase [Caulobacterales bacterium]